VAVHLFGDGDYNTPRGCLGEMLFYLTEEDVDEILEQYKPFPLTEGDRKMFEACAGSMNDATKKEVAAFLLNKMRSAF